MTHEHHADPTAEDGGPERDYTLPDAASIPGDLSAQESDLPPLPRMSGPGRHRDDERG